MEAYYACKCAQEQVSYCNRRACLIISQLNHDIRLRRRKMPVVEKALTRSDSTTALTIVEAVLETAQCASVDEADHLESHGLFSLS